ncbi:hypothetical protein JZ751_006891 [Albula glossodonta]|uniref:Uncharacterized protein n=1 Tax=Albula glossodonta TaxID=121402 RepID=A0A8T2P447_9TELE|nr:hypothetical protein JZ751_006891 [Albula glossodonta]
MLVTSCHMDRSRQLHSENMAVRIPESTSGTWAVSKRTPQTGAHYLNGEVGEAVGHLRNADTGIHVGYSTSPAVCCLHRSQLNIEENRKRNVEADNTELHCCLWA